MDFNNWSSLPMVLDFSFFTIDPLDTVISYMTENIFTRNGHHLSELLNATFADAAGLIVWRLDVSCAVSPWWPILHTSQTHGVSG
jgi:hypothetical protein